MKTDIFDDFLCLSLSMVFFAFAFYIIVETLSTLFKKKE